MPRNPLFFPNLEIRMTAKFWNFHEMLNVPISISRRIDINGRCWKMTYYYALVFYNIPTAYLKKEKQASWKCTCWKQNADKLRGSKLTSLYQKLKSPKGHNVKDHVGKLIKQKLNYKLNIGHVSFSWDNRQLFLDHLARFWRQHFFWAEKLPVPARILYHNMQYLPKLMIQKTKNLKSRPGLFFWALSLPMAYRKLTSDRKRQTDLAS